MESAIQSMVKVFLKSTKGKESLGKKEFQGLVKSQLSNILSDTDSKEAVNNMGQGLDADQDGKVGFEEYMKLVGYLACSLSEQRNLAPKGEQVQNAASGQVPQSVLAKEEEKPEANAGAKEEAKPEGNEEPKVEACAPVKLELNADPMVEVKLEANADPKVDLKVEAKAEGATEPEAAKVVEIPGAAAVVELPGAAAVVDIPGAAAVVAAGEGPATAVETVVKEVNEIKDVVVVAGTDKVVEVVEKVSSVVEEGVVMKTEEATS